jgi:hypothetical protein
MFKMKMLIATLAVSLVMITNSNVALGEGASANATGTGTATSRSTSEGGDATGGNATGGNSTGGNSTAIGGGSQAIPVPNIVSTPDYTRIPHPEKNRKYWNSSLEKYGNCVSVWKEESIDNVLNEDWWSGDGNMEHWFTKNYSIKVIVPKSKFRTPSKSKQNTTMVILSLKENPDQYWSFVLENYNRVGEAYSTGLQKQIPGKYVDIKTVEKFRKIAHIDLLVFVEEISKPVINAKTTTTGWAVTGGVPNAGATLSSSQSDGKSGEGSDEGRKAIGFVKKTPAEKVAYLKAKNASLRVAVSQEIDYKVAAIRAAAAKRALRLNLLRRADLTGINGNAIKELYASYGLPYIPGDAVLSKNTAKPEKVSVASK